MHGQNHIKFAAAILTNIHVSDGHFVKLVLLLTFSFPTTESDQQTRYMKLHCLNEIYSRYKCITLL